MLAPEQLQSLNELVARLDARQMDWLAGYVSGLRAVNDPLPPYPPPPSLISSAAIEEAKAESQVTVLYGSQTGNAKSIAEKAASAIGVRARIVGMRDYKTAQLKREKFLFAVVSTHGEGDPPDDARPFYDFLMGKRAPQLPNLSFGVLALGDSGYEHFCQTGREIDSRLIELGAKRILSLAECDVDFAKAADKWKESIAATAADASPTISDELNGHAILNGATTPLPSPLAYSRENPFTATIIANIKLNDGNSSRDTRHLELSLEGSGMTFAPGDSLGVLPKNPPELVARIIALLKADADSQITINGESNSLNEWLSCKLEIAQLTPPVLGRYADAVGDDKLRARAADFQAARKYLDGRDLANLLADYPPPSPPSDEEIAKVLNSLRRLAPRLYSIASSPNAREDEAHILVGETRFYSPMIPRLNGSAKHGAKLNGEAIQISANKMRYGLASRYLAARQPDDAVRVYIHPAERFRLPENDDASAIMIGPGTGIAPFRAFLEERENRGAQGKNWIFFGERQFADDFYYQAEWLRLRASGILTKIDAAFSRDGADKIYVQHKLRKQGSEIFQWLEKDAHLYVCGDEKKMAKDAENALLEIIAAESGKDENYARAYLETMRQQNRYQRDVY